MGGRIGRVRRTKEEDIIVGVLVCEDGTWGGEPPTHTPTQWSIVEDASRVIEMMYQCINIP